MSVLRLLLALTVLFSSAVIGLHFYRRLIRRHDILCGFHEMFSRAQIEIAYNTGDLCEMFGENFAGFPFDRAVPFDVQWTELVQRFSYWIKAEDTALLYRFADGLGKSDVSSQQRHMELYTKRLEEAVASSGSEIDAKGKMYRLLPLSAGMILAILIV